jgi:radical SAM superfamily enzyme YgiQ (UPF0313 family)
VEGKVGEDIGSSKVFHVKQSSPHILLINPWVTDFAAYNLWIKPLGLLRIGSFLREKGFRITFIDCLDFYAKKKEYGVGKFFKTKIGKPFPIKSIPRNYSRYGMTEEMLTERLSAVEKPDVIGITSGMTYWYPGLFKVIELIKRSFKEVPTLLGGIYATLCHDHALKFSGADFVIQGKGEAKILDVISELTQFRFTPNSELRTENSLGSLFDPFEFRNAFVPYPCFDLYPQLDSVCISTSKGCPFQCAYCASRFLDKEFARRDPLEVVKEIEYWTTQYQIKNIAFYDDALLIEPYSHIVPILKDVIRRDIRCNFHAPNGLHIRGTDKEVASLLFRSQFKTIRLGFETSNETEQIETGRKVTNQEFSNAVRNLKKAGYSPEEIGVYILAGLPGQRAEEVEESIAYTKEAGAKPILVEYSPVPGTSLFEVAMRTSQFDIENEPLFHNNSILPCQWEGFTPADYRKLKDEVKKGVNV